MSNIFPEISGMYKTDNSIVTQEEYAKQEWYEVTAMQDDRRYFIPGRERKPDEIESYREAYLQLMKMKRSDLG